MTRPLLIAGVGRPGARALGRRAGDVELLVVPTLPAADSLDPLRPTVVLVDREMLSRRGARAGLEALFDVATLVGYTDADGALPDELPADLLSGVVAAGSCGETALAQVMGAFHHARARVAARTSAAESERRRREIDELSRIGAAMSSERDLDTLLGLILSHARRVTGSDAGSIYLVERQCGETRLRFKLAQNDSLPGLALGEFTLPADHTSLAGYVAATGLPLMVEDAYALAEEAGYRQNRAFDERLGYRTKSTLVVPLRTQRDDVVGVLQLINRVRSPGTRLTSLDAVEREVVAYDARSSELAGALAGQAAVSIENGQLYASIERLFEGFVTAATSAIEQRDPPTHGHSARVAELSVRLARALDGADAAFSATQLRELRYAALLHDFGKLGVREELLLKAEKLYPAELEAIRSRFAQAELTALLDAERARTAYLVTHGSRGYEAARDRIEEARRMRVAELSQGLALVESANRPSVLPEGGPDALRGLAGLRFRSRAGDDRPLLTAGELARLAIRQGTLDAGERAQIESHVEHTNRFLREIPWTPELARVPEIAYAHHERLDGRGYPRGVSADEIPLATRIMAVADIFDALSAADRPYKRAVRVEEALDILREEARRGMLDPALVEVFIEARVYESPVDEPSPVAAGR